MRRKSKPPRITLGVNTLAQVDSAAYRSHLGMIAYTRNRYQRKHLEIIHANPYRMSIDRMRNFTAQMALQWDSDYLMFVDDDVLVPENCIEILYEAMKAQDLGVIAGVTYVRGYPFNPMIFQEKRRRTIYAGKKIKDAKLKAPEPIGDPLMKMGKTLALEFDVNYKKRVKRTGKDILPCYAVGFSCALINMEIIRRMPPPYFVTGTGQTEDVYFCCRVMNEFEPTPKIMFHNGVQTGHILMPEAVDHTNVEKLRVYYKEQIDAMAPKTRADKRIPAIDALIERYKI